MASDQASKERVMQLDGEGRQAFAAGAYARAREAFEQAVEACRAMGWREELVYQLIHVSQVMQHEPGYFPSNARPLVEEALRVAQSTGQARWMLPAQISLLRLDLQEGSYTAALHRAQASLPTALEAGFDDFAGILLQYAAFACVGLGQFEAALRLNSAAQAQHDREGAGTPTRSAREGAERNLAPARRAFSHGKRSAIEALGYQMSLQEAAGYLKGIEVGEEEE